MVRNASTLIEELENELMYYQALLLTDLNPSNASIINALRIAVDIRTELTKLKGADSMSRLIRLIESLEKENMELKRIISER